MSPSNPPSSHSDSTPTVSELSADFAKQKRAKSPPLAFEKTSNDSLGTGDVDEDAAAIAVASSSMGRLSSIQSERDNEMQRVIDQQNAALLLLHNACAAERQAWASEREWLHQRIAKLEKLLKTGDGYSPAKSPVLSPLNHSAITSPQSKSTTNRLPSIAEDEPIPSLSERRAYGPKFIDISIQQPNVDESASSVSFREGSPAEIKVEEIPAPPTATLSPPPFYNRQAAGHTPLRAPRPLTPPPRNSLAIDGVEDTPTRNNTHLNSMMTKSNDEDEEKELSGPLNMPELPNNPSEGQFTFEALSKRLEQIERSPEERLPTVFKVPSPGVASPAPEATNGSEAENKPDQPPLAPVPTHKPASTSSSNIMSSEALSPLTKHASREDKVQADFEQGGIRLKAKSSMNFGMPFGQLGAFGRRVSQDRE